MRAPMRVLVTLFLSFGLIGCERNGGSDLAAAESASRGLSPQDKALAGIYDRSCRSCHTIAATGAPLTGDESAWKIRMDKGMSTLVDNVINGFGGMPPFGMCMDCGQQEFEALIVFMATAESSP